MSDEYNDLTAANSDVLVQLKQIICHLHDLSNHFHLERVNNAIDKAEDYRYQYNAKIIGLLESASESALKLTSQVSVGVLILSSEAYESLIILLPKTRSYSLKPRNSKNMIIATFAGPRTLLFTSRRMRVPT